MDTIILASGSPRRRELLSSVKIPFRVVAPEVEEDYSAACPVAELVAAIARRKAEAVAAMFAPESPPWILGVDTVVEVNGKLLGKPDSVETAHDMLEMLSGKVHSVYSGLALLAGKRRPADTEAARTEVKFRQMSEEEIRFLLDAGEWAGAAGAYRIQERGAFFVEWIRGSYSNVVGLPLEAFYGILMRNRYIF